MFLLFLKGLLIGLSIAAPVGPIGVLCINRSIHDGFKSGLAVGAGAAFADGVYGVIAAFGLSFISSFLIRYVWWIQLIGGIFLIYLAIKTFKTNTPKQLTITTSKKGLFKIFTTTFFLTLTNPLTILSFVAIFAGLGLGSMHTNYSAATAMVSGIILGSLLWWLGLSSTITFFVKRIKSDWFQWTNIFSAAIIFLFGVAALIRLL